MTTRVGTLSDTHDDLCDWDAVRGRIAKAFADVDLILHCGDITSAQALDDLEEIAPVRATRSINDPPANPPRLDDGPAVIDVGGTPVLLAFERPADVPPGVRVVVFGGTHAASVETVDGVLWVNPGSPSLAKETTVAVLAIGSGEPPTAEVVPL